MKHKMKMNKKGTSPVEVVIVLFIIALLLFVIIRGIGGCKQIVARNYGGTVTIKLDPNVKLVNATWKGNEMWLLTKSMQTNDIPENWKFEERSVLGILQGTVNIQESK